MREEIVEVPVEPLMGAEMMLEASRDPTHGRADIYVPAGRIGPLPETPYR
jgi:hypothetical protein